MSNPNTNADPHLVTIHNVRLSYSDALFVAKQGRDANGNPSGVASYGCVFLLDKVVNKEDIAKLTAAAHLTKKEKWQDKPVNLTGKSIRDGAEKEATDGYGPGVVFISARHTPRNGSKPRVVDQKFNDLTAEDGRPYAGCYVDAIVRCWPQDNNFGKRLNWDLKTVQFRRHGKPFGTPAIDPKKYLSELPDDDSQVDSTAATADQGI